MCSKVVFANVKSTRATRNVVTAFCRRHYCSDGQKDIPVEDYVDFRPARQPRSEKYNLGDFLKKHRKGLFEISELVSFLKDNQNVQDLFVCKVSPKLRYVDYVVIGSGLSNRHNTRIAEAFKRKMAQNVSNPDGLKYASNEKWIALDLGNIVLHLMNDDSREFYDLETLWAVGPDPSNFTSFM